MVSPLPTFMPCPTAETCSSDPLDLVNATIDTADATPASSALSTPVLTFRSHKEASEDESVCSTAAPGLATPLDFGEESPVGFSAWPTSLMSSSCAERA